MKKKFKRITSLATAVIMSASLATGVSAYSGPENAALKNRSCSITYGVATGTATYTSYYQTAVNVDGNYYKMDGYAEIHKGPTEATYRSFSAKIRTYYSGAKGADDTIYDTHISGNGNTVATWTADTLAITLELQDYEEGNSIKKVARTTKSSASVFTKSGGGYVYNTAHRSKVFSTIESSNSNLGVVIVSRPSRTI